MSGSVSPATLGDGEVYLLKVHETLAELFDLQEVLGFKFLDVADDAAQF